MPNCSCFKNKCIVGIFDIMIKIVSKSQLAKRSNSTKSAYQTSSVVLVKKISYLRNSLVLKSLFTAFSLILMLAACQSESDGNNQVANNLEPSFTISGVISGHIDIIAIQLNDNAIIEVNSETKNFTFATELDEGDTYNISLVRMPDNQECFLQNETGTITNTNITNVLIACGNVGEIIGIPDVTYQEGGAEAIKIGGIGIRNYTTSVDINNRILRTLYYYRDYDPDVGTLYGKRTSLISRILSTGEPDLSFNGSGYVLFKDGIANEIAESVAITAHATDPNSGSIFIAGFLTDWLSRNFRPFIAKLSDSGELDEDFGNNGLILMPDQCGSESDYYKKIIVLDNGNIILGGNSSDIPFLFAIDPYGLKDINFDAEAIHCSETTGYLGDLKITENNKILALTSSNATLFKLNSDNGSLDPQFGTNNGYVNTIIEPSDSLFGNQMEVFSDGSIYVAGRLELSYGTYSAIIIKYNIDGTPAINWADNSVFELKEAGFRFFVNDIALDYDGNLYWTGAKRNENITLSVPLYTFRLGLDGTQSMSFGTSNNGLLAISGAPLPEKDTEEINQDGFTHNFRSMFFIDNQLYLSFTSSDITFEYNFYEYFGTLKLR